jgi:hypothetical protein
MDLKDSLESDMTFERARKVLAAASKTRLVREILLE